jgi:hypothetical protein
MGKALWKRIRDERPARGALVERGPELDRSALAAAPKIREGGREGGKAPENATPKFDRTAYQREYMRAWRKRRKEGKLKCLLK